MDLFADSCGPAAASSGPDDRGVRRVHFHEFLYDVHRELHRLRQGHGDKTTKAVAQGIARSTRVLAFDEFQITNISDALIVETLFHALFEAGVAVVMTSNRPPEDLYKDGLNRHLAIPQFLALLERRRVGFLCLAAARDFRNGASVSASAARASASSASGGVGVGSVEGPPGEGPWRDFLCKVAPRSTGAGGSSGSDAGTEVQSFLDKAFAEAAGGTPRGEPERVPIAWGRSLEVEESAAGVCRFSFAQLCGGPLNADDYLSLTNRFHTLVVADVPCFSLEQHNEARRFTNLVDCAYERHVRLVLSAEAPPTRLLASMEELATVALHESASELDNDSVAAVVPGDGSSDWVRHNPFGPVASSITQAARRAAAGGPNDAAPGDDDSKTGAGVAGVMAGAVGSLQESGFAARRATSRLLHMQSDDYLAAHLRHRRGGEA